MDFWRAIRILGRRKWLILMSVMASIAATFGATRLIGSRWQATVRFVAEDPLFYSSSQGGPAPEAAKFNPVTAQAQAQVFAQILQSADVVGPALQKIQLGQPPVGMLESIQVKAAGPRLFQFLIQDRSPGRVTEIANALADAFVEKNHRISTSQATSVVEFLEEQVRDASRQLKDARSRYDAYRRRQGLVAGLDSHLAPAMARLQSARQRRDTVSEAALQVKAQLEARQAELRTLPPTLAIERPLSDSPLIHKLEQDLASAETELTRLRSKYTDARIEVQQALALRDTLKARLNEELSHEKPLVVEQPNSEVVMVQRMMLDLKNQLRGYEAQLSSLDQIIASVEHDIQRFTGVDGTLGVLQSAVTEKTQAYDFLAARLQNARIALDVASRQNPVQVMDRVGPLNPPIDTTAGRTLKLLLMAALCALLGSGGLIIALDNVDTRVKSVSDAEEILPAPVLAAIPQAIGAVTPGILPRATEYQPRSLHSEAYRFLGLHLLNNRGRRIRSVMGVAAKAGQGSSAMISNLGITLAQAGYRVILVDANIRDPQLHGVFDLPNTYGFSDLLLNASPEACEQALHATGIERLRVIPSGKLPLNPWELLRSANLRHLSDRLRDLADYVLYDTPSALAFTDAFNLIPAVDAAVLCVRALEAPSGAERKLVQALEEANVRVLGSVLSDVPAASLESYENYQHYYPMPAVDPTHPGNRANEVDAGAKVSVAPEISRDPRFGNGNGLGSNGSSTGKTGNNGHSGNNGASDDGPLFL